MAVVVVTTVETGADTIWPFMVEYPRLRVKPVFGAKLLVGWIKGLGLIGYGNKHSVWVSGEAVANVGRINMPSGVCHCSTVCC